MSVKIGSVKPFSKCFLKGIKAGDELLKINGNDIKKLGVTEGVKIGKILKMLLSLVIEDKLENEKSALLNKTEEIRDEI